MTFFTFKGSKARVWGATCTDSFSTSNRYTTILNSGSASSAAEDLKRRKYSQLETDLEFVPVAVETSGIIGAVECSLLTNIGHCISRATSDPRQMCYILEQMSAAIIRANALAIISSLGRKGYVLFGEIALKNNHYYYYMPGFANKLFHVLCFSSLLMIVFLVYNTVRTQC